MHKLLFFASMLLLLASCGKERVTGSGAVTTSERQLEEFNKVSAGGMTPVYIEKGNTFKAVVKGYSNLHSYLKTNVLNNGTLEIGFDNDAFIRNNNVEVFVTMPFLQKVKQSGSGKVTVKNGFKQDEMEADLSGSGGIDIEGGSAHSFGANLSGSGKIRAFGLQTRESNVWLSGSGIIQVTAYWTLKANVSGSGEVQYKGNPTVESSVSGSGIVVRKD